MIKLFLKSPNNGWTLIGLAVVAIIAGILAATAGPQMMGMQKRSQISQAQSLIKGAIQEVQQNAVRRGSTCTATIANNTVTASPIGCLSSVPKMPGDITFTTANFANTPATIVFSFKGNAVISTTADPATIIIQSPGTGSKKCLIISSGLGLIRAGDYDTSCAVSL